ncbi:YKL069W [Candida margitis]|uniref:YKL069W n=1 Tax=Candida margitis TaxID=1775924 RepID=UPI00222768F7|nr:YKL069W [Candida margitis]KAI5949852.1 YKL069W [Candida margitis]
MVHHADYTNFSSSTSTSATSETKRETLQQLLDAYTALETPYLISNLSNCASLLWHAYHSLGINVNWTGFYTSENYHQINHTSQHKTNSNSNSNNSTNSSTTPELLLGPFQGKVACQSIKWGQGVCGTAAATAQSQVVSDINKFPGHIACDGETKSEIVVPIILHHQRQTDNGNNKGTDDGDTVVGVIDLDCLDLAGFDETDREYLEQLAALLSKSFL